MRIKMISGIGFRVKIKFNLVTLKIRNLSQLINSVDAEIEADLDDWKGVKRDLLRKR